ncbi:DEKNAAC103321 [Brettanomyces naardenensis]|uniref:DEKNAAC103321 n=1 Tax=Brettanomyces naardenensis TaxID=13370 RepID=A0A448YN57_BRENA|nr:DEKNAAC103321 [Brettanomyces naardenensis]
MLRATKGLTTIGLGRGGLGTPVGSSLTLLRFKSDTLSTATPKDFSPHAFARHSGLPNIPNPETPNKDIDPKRKLEKPVYERGRVTMPQWKKAFGEAFVSLFGIDMDKIRAGSIGGSKYFYMCKDQGLQFKDEPLSESAVFWYETLGLPRTFAQWYQITVLHIWMLFVRMRAMPFKIGKNYQQKIVDKLFKDIELRLSEEMNVLSGSIRDRYMKDFHSQMIGIVGSLDEALASESDSILAATLWRNVFNGDRNIDVVKLEAVVRYVRMQLYVLDKISDRAFGFGDFEFVSPSETVDPLTPEEEKQLKTATRNKYDPGNEKVLPSQRSVLSIDE